MEEYCANGPEIDLVEFEEIAGARIHYARPPVADYGSLGKARKPRLDRSFLERCEACLQEIWDRCPQGKAMAVVSAGCYVEKAGMHGAGRAIDIDSIWWSMTTPPLVTLHYPHDRARYLAVEAILRKYFGIVLDYHYNSAHKDHWHIDDSQAVGFHPSASRVVFIQAALIHLFGSSIKHDGEWGSQTAKAVMTGTAGDLRVLDNWLGFLDVVADRGFESWT